jgi:polysaccharide export outer membrane protein
MRQLFLNVNVIRLGSILILLAGCSSSKSTTNTKTGNTQASVPTSTPTPVAVSVSTPADALRLGDTLDIRLTGVPGPEAGVYSEKINESGEISMPLVGKFKAAGFTTGQLKDQIEASYKKYYTTPNITILPQPRFVNIDGDVRAPQRVVYTEDMSVLIAINSCGGFTDFADQRNIKIVRGGKIIKFDAKAAREKPELDIKLQPGDILKIERSIW